jgi:hypothetical protein
MMYVFLHLHLGGGNCYKKYGYTISTPLDWEYSEDQPGICLTLTKYSNNGPDSKLCKGFNEISVSVSNFVLHGWVFESVSTN